MTPRKRYIGKQQQKEGTKQETVSRYLPKPILYDLRTELKEFSAQVEQIALKEGMIYHETQQISQTMVAYSADIPGQPLVRFPTKWVGPAANAPEQDLVPVNLGNMALLLHQLILGEEVALIEPLLQQLVQTWRSCQNPGPRLVVLLKTYGVLWTAKVSDRGQMLTLLAALMLKNKVTDNDATSPGLVYPPPKPGLAFAIPTAEQSAQNLAKAAPPLGGLKKENPLSAMGKEPTRVPARILKNRNGTLGGGALKVPVMLGPVISRTDQGGEPRVSQKSCSSW